MSTVPGAGMSPQYAAGVGHFTVPAGDSLPAFPAIVVYPTLVRGADATIGPYTFDATLDAPVAAGAYPLCVISHGGGGSHLLYRSIATHLAAHGWVVVCPEHPYDNRNDRSRVNTDEAARDRPRHIVRTIDSLLGDARWGPHIDATRIAMVGHSMGGFTALALGGGQPWSNTRVPLGTVTDARIKAAVLLAPAEGWYMAPGALDGVHMPLLVMVGEHDPVTPPERVRAVLAALPLSTPVSIEEVPGAGHFAFITPFPEAMHRPDFPPSVDPPGFDRQAFHRVLPERIRRFLEATVV